MGFIWFVLAAFIIAAWFLSGIILKQKTLPDSTKNRILKTLRVICILPYPIVGIHALITAFSPVGITFFMDSKVYGIDALLITGVFDMIWLLPVFASSVTGIVITTLLIEKSKNKENKGNK